MKLKKKNNHIKIQNLPFTFRSILTHHLMSIFSNSPFLKKEEQKSFNFLLFSTRFKISPNACAIGVAAKALNVVEDYSRCEIFVDRFKIHFIHSKRRASGK